MRRFTNVDLVDLHLFESSDGLIMNGTIEIELESPHVPGAPGPLVTVTISADAAAGKTVQNVERELLANAVEALRSLGAIDADHLRSELVKCRREHAQDQTQAQPDRH